MVEFNLGFKLDALLLGIKAVYLTDVPVARGVVLKWGRSDLRSYGATDCLFSLYISLAPAQPLDTTLAHSPPLIMHHGIEAPVAGPDTHIAHQVAPNPFQPIFIVVGNSSSTTPYHTG